MSYGQIEKSAYAGADMLRPSRVAVRDILREQLANLREQATRIETLLNLLEKNPDFEKMLDLSRGLI